MIGVPQFSSLGKLPYFALIYIYIYIYTYTHTHTNMICISIYTLCIFREEPMSLCAFLQIFSPQHGLNVFNVVTVCRISLPTVKQATFERPPLLRLGEWSNQNQGANEEATPFRNIS